MKVSSIPASLVVVFAVFGLIFSSAIELNAQSKQSSSQFSKKSASKKSASKKSGSKKSGSKKSGSKNPSGGSPSGGSSSAPTPEMITVQGGALPSGSGLAGQTAATFQIGKYEVTWGEWKAVRDWAVNNGYSDLANVGSGSGDDHPVREVSWYDVVKWCNARSEKEGLVPVYQVGGAVYKTGESVPTVNSSANGYRLPLEKEWEWAARGGVRSQGYTYSGSNDVNAVAWHWNNSSGAAVILWEGRGTWPVGQKGANELGIYDMSGNVDEWCENKYDPKDENISANRVSRGGGWNYPASGLRSAARNSASPPIRIDFFGFRVARYI
jgi:formylglycine-generating enzyme required for sulfatase activity